MSDPAPQLELFRSLGQLIRGLSALFWGLPLTLLICARTATSEWLKPLGFFPPLLCTTLLFFGLWQLSQFQRQERIWIRAVERAKVLAVINIGLSPFIFWWNKLPQIPFFSMSVGLLMLSGLLFLLNLNFVLQRLVAMLPDETLRLETRWFTSVNMGLLATTLLLITAYFLLLNSRELLQVMASALQGVGLPIPSLVDVHRPALISNLLHRLEPIRAVLVIFLVLLPLALTMTLLWKIKEVVLNSVFSGNR